MGESTAGLTDCGPVVAVSATRRQTSGARSQADGDGRRKELGNKRRRLFRLIGIHIDFELVLGGSAFGGFQTSQRSTL